MLLLLLTPRSNGSLQYASTKHYPNLTIGRPPPPPPPPYLNGGGVEKNENLPKWGGGGGGVGWKFSKINGENHNAMQEGRLLKFPIALEQHSMQPPKNK